MTAVRVATYLRAALSVAWRAIIGRPCACDWCRLHRTFIRESATAYRAEVRALTAASHEGAPR